MNPFRRGSVLLVLGMHRSGTSALTRVLSFAGGRLPRTLFDAVEGDNDLGYWESRRLIERHEAIFARIGTTMLAGDPIDPAWFRSRDAAVEEAALAGIVHEEWKSRFGGSARCWLIKEPRICRLMPLWRGVLARIGRRVAAVHALREPTQVAASLARRGRMQPELASRVWLEHVLSAERWTRDLPRAFTTFDHLMDDWQSTVAHVASLLPKGDLDARRAESAVPGFLTPSLRHHRGDDGVANNTVRRVRDALMLACREGRVPDTHLLDEAWRIEFGGSTACEARK